MPELLRQAADLHGDRPAIVDEEVEVTITFRALAMLAEETARAWMALGVGRGDRVAVWAPNSWAWEVAALGVHLAGAVLVPISTRFKGREAAAILGKTRARALVIQNEFLGVDYLRLLRDAGFDAAQEELPIVALGAEAPAGTLRWSAFLARGRSVGREELAARTRSVAPDDASDVIFTSGTTGRPKGVVATHAQTLGVFRTWCELGGLTAGDRYLVVNPFFHTFGYKAGWLACLLTGATCYPHAVFDAGKVLARIESAKITVLPGPPTLYQSLLEHPDRAKRDISSLRLAVTGAATIPVELIRRMRDDLGFDTVLSAYGLTEATGVVTMSRRGDPIEVIATTSGRAIPGVEVKIAQHGEIWLRGYNVMRGYFEDREESEKAITHDGWLRTGDVGAFDGNGNLRITDRLKDMFIVGGFNAWPAEIEDLLLGHSAVARAAVVGAPDARLGEVGVAFVVLKPGVHAIAEEIIDFARSRMANYKVPRRVVFLDELPLNASGKVQKPLLRQRAAELVRA
jgi:acyl-CoA synthetase (AMP-forming)/AMP-acid ligase II